jgi:phosphatidylglycerophosphate synthase
MEKRALLWLARRMPSWVTPDHLTLCGFAAMILAGVCYWLSQWNPWVLLGAVLCLAVNWFGDSLDGTLARVRNRQRPRSGFYVDNVIDALGMFWLIGGLALSGYMHVPVALGLLVAYFMVSIEVYLATYTRSVFRLSFLYWGPTELRVLLSIGNIVLLFHPTVTLGNRVFLLYDVGAVIAIGALAAVLTVSVVKNTTALYEEERLS